MDRAEEMRDVCGRFEKSEPLWRLVETGLNGQTLSCPLLNPGSGKKVRGAAAVSWRALYCPLRESGSET